MMTSGSQTGVEARRRCTPSVLGSVTNAQSSSRNGADSPISKSSPNNPNTTPRRIACPSRTGNGGFCILLRFLSLSASVARNH